MKRNIKGTFNRVPNGNFLKKAKLKPIFRKLGFKSVEIRNLAGILGMNLGICQL
ncbi:MAG: hypothetical protein NHB14_22555 [Desulfosporosinus sp.]|nr:hypothetical protein [Desulfosporosinus sp.]